MNVSGRDNWLAAALVVTIAYVGIGIGIAQLARAAFFGALVASSVLGRLLARERRAASAHPVASQLKT